MDEKRFENIVSALSRTFRVPAKPDYDEMGQAIEAAHFDAARARGLRNRRVLSIAPWLAVAAALVLGIAIGRRSTGPSSNPQVAVAASPASGTAARTSTGADAYRDETTHYLEQAAA